MPGALSGPGLNSGCCGTQMPSLPVIQQISQLIGGLDPNQIRTLHQVLGERVQGQGRMIPEFFGEMPRSPPGVGHFGENSAVLPGFASGNPENSEERGQRDVFSRSEKWLAPAPVPEASKWLTREQEIVGFAEYVSHLASWAAQASLEFSVEIRQASRWGSTIQWSMLTSLQRNRATRLLAILRSAFESHPRTSMLIAAFVEGVNLQRSSMVGFDMGYSGQGSNGFELLRVLTSEFSLRTRAEALSLRATMSNKSFVLSANETTPLTEVTDVVRRLDLECAKYSKLIATLPEGVDGTGLGIPESDMLLVLLRSLPEGVRN